MSKKLLTLAFSTMLAVLATAWLSGAAQAGPPTVCGDGNIEGDEVCDDGNTVPDDTCSFPSCLPRVCGDTIVNPDPGTDEQCDDGNTVDDDLCDNNCQLNCGDGTIEGTETCDDSGESATCDDDCTAVDCGDGNVNETAGEECDDSNTASGDGCSAECLSELADPQTKKQQGCINAVNKNVAGVAKGQGSDISKCVKDTAAGKVADPTNCLVAGAKTTKAAGKTTKTATGKKCTGTDIEPDYAFTDAATANGAGSDQVLEGANAILGAPPTIAPKAEKENAKCQGEAIKQYNTILNKWFAEANKAKKTVLKGGKNDTPPQAGNPTDIAAFIDSTMAANAKVTQATTKAGEKIAKSCEGVTIDPLFDCGGAADATALATCVATEAIRAACEALEAADGFDLTCP
jgi:cysteine-rich repeat protein